MDLKVLNKKQNMCNHIILNIQTKNIRKNGFKKIKNGPKNRKNVNGHRGYFRQTDKQRNKKGFPPLYNRQIYICIILE